MDDDFDFPLPDNAFDAGEFDADLDEEWALADGTRW
jgi:hypothetical protein